jgi:hypothetical protein
MCGSTNKPPSFLTGSNAVLAELRHRHECEKTSMVSGQGLPTAEKTVRAHHCAVSIRELEVARLGTGH